MGGAEPMPGRLLPDSPERTAQAAGDRAGGSADRTASTLVRSRRWPRVSVRSSARAAASTRGDDVPVLVEDVAGRVRVGRAPGDFRPAGDHTGDGEARAVAGGADRCDSGVGVGVGGLPGGVRGAGHCPCDGEHRLAVRRFDGSGAVVHVVLFRFVGFCPPHRALHYALLPGPKGAASDAERPWIGRLRRDFRLCSDQRSRDLTGTMNSMR